MAGPQGQARRPGRGPGLFNVSEGDETDEEDGEDAHSRVPHNIIASKARIY